MCVGNIQRSSETFPGMLSRFTSRVIRASLARSAEQSPETAMHLGNTNRKHASLPNNIDIFIQHKLPLTLKYILSLIFVLDILAQLDARIASLLGRANDKSWFCKSCGKASLIKQEMSRHIEAYHIENHPGVKCDICGMISKTRHALIVHTTRKHKTNNSQDFYVN